jgi:hypothetical protein
MRYNKNKLGDRSTNIQPDGQSTMRREDKQHDSDEFTDITAEGPISRGTEFLSILPAALGPGVRSTSNRNKYQKQKNNVSEE